MRGHLRTSTFAAAVLAVATLVTGVLPVVERPPALASITPAVFPEQVQGDVNLLFSRGGSPARYASNSVVRIDAGNINFVKGCIPGPGGRGFPDFVQATADLYIVPSGRRFLNGDGLSDALGAPNSVWAGLGGSFLWEPLAITGSAGSGSGLPSGTYDVVVDECQNQIWDTGQDTVVRDAFVVDIDQEVPGFDYEIAEFQALKTRAGNLLGKNTQVESVLNQILLLEISKQVESVAGAAAGFTGGATSMVKVLIGSIDPTAALKNFGKTVILNSVQKRRVALINLRDDPPDPNFQQFATPVRVAETIASPFGELDEATALSNVGDAIAATEEAFVRALERYQGAEAAGNVAWATRHARSLDELASLHAELTAAQLVLVQAVVDKYLYDGGPVPPDQINLRTLLSNYVSILATTYENQGFWWNTGLTVEQAEAAADAYLDDVVDAPPRSVGIVGTRLPDLAAAAVSDSEFSTELRAWADTALPGVLTELDSVTNPILADPAVSISPVVGAAAGATVTLGVELPAGYVADSIRWDLDGDGVFDDASGAAPEWLVPGNLRAGTPFVIAVEVVGGLTADVAYEVVTPVAGNLPPTVELTAPIPATGVPGATTTLEVSTTDPEGGPVTVEWFIEGTPTGSTGDSFDVAVPADFYGQIEVLAVATDAAGATAMTVIPLGVRSGVDVDRDGYFAAPGPDCDDDEFFVNPGRAEVVGNSIDDDCDPATSDAGTPISPGAPRQQFFRSVEGDVYEFSLENWVHPNRRDDVPFTVTVEWGDGTTSTQTVQGTDTASTNFLLTHRYVDELAEGDLHWCVSNGADPDGCGSRIGSIDTDNEPPFVGAADLRTWTEENSGENPAQCRNVGGCGVSGEWLVDGDGRWAVSTGNPNDHHVLFSPVDLAEGGYGRGMVELSVPFPSGDDDLMGLVVGYEAGDVLGLTGDEDFLDFEWLGRGRGRQSGESATNPPECNGVVAAPGDELTDPATISRTRGPAAGTERSFNLVLDAVEDGGGPVNPLCADSFGVDELLAIEFQADEIDVNPLLGGWLSRAIDRNTLREAPSGPLATPYTFTVDYRPDRLRMWTSNGSLVADVAPRDANDPFPAGGLGLVYYSQVAIRAKGTAPELEFTFTQGSEGAITMPFTDGGDDEWIATIDWGDGGSQSFGTISDNATGAGWHDVTASHTYLRAGDLRGEVCVIDDLEEGSCFTFRATVENLPPVVEAGPDVVDEADLVSGATLSLEQATFTDPGATDDHTATIDWGDGSPLANGVVTSSRSAGGTVTGTHTYDADGVYEVEVCVTDQVGDTGCDTLDVDVRVSNQPPVASVEVPAAPDSVDTEVLLGGGFTDPNPDDTHTMTIDPGDGTGPQAVPVQQGPGVGMSGLGHVYTSAGTFTVTACITDGDGSTDCASAEFEALGDGVEPPSDVPFIVATEPARFADTRATGDTIDDRNEATGTLTPGEITRVQIAGRGDIPATGVTSAVINIASVRPARQGFFTVYPCTPELPTASALNYLDDNRANEIIAKLSPTGEVCIYNSQPTEMLVDVVGYVPTGSDYVSTDPARFADTRSTGETIDGDNEAAGILDPGETIEIQITGRGDVPDDAPLESAVLNIASVRPAERGFFTVYACTAERPNASALNYLDDNRANEIIAKLSPTGSVCVYTLEATHLLVDVVGYVPVGSDYTAIDPARFADTRPTGETIDDESGKLGILDPGETVEIQIAGRGGVPMAGIDAAVINIASVRPARQGFFTVYPCTPERPNASALNYLDDNRANEIITKLSPTGSICVYTSRTTHLLVDVVGHIAE